MVARFSTYLIGDPEVTIEPRFIMTVNSGEAIQFPLIKEELCLLCVDIQKVNTTEQVNE